MSANLLAHAAEVPSLWRTVAVGETFHVPQGIHAATRNANYYKRKYGHEFACRKAEDGAGTIVRRVR
ncbi:hypothetical protein [Dongia deserti]|uniref:hypothetical protein n=1 Tax=Dongia deserti TaxID=2268030 RepID=UPI000E656F9B|nr:hypothetical protein [Dongia deserti]